MSLPWVRDAVRKAIGVDPYPGTLNVRLSDTDMLQQWHEIRTIRALPLVPPPTERCGGQLVPITVAPDVRAGVIIPDVTRYGDDVLEIVAAVHLRSRLGLRDDTTLTISV